MTSGDDGPSPVCLVYLVCFVYFVGLVQPNKQDKPNEQDRLVAFFSSLLRKEIGRVSPRGFVEMECTAALLFRLIHRRVGMLQ